MPAAVGEKRRDDGVGPPTHPGRACRAGHLAGSARRPADRARAAESLPVARCPSGREHHSMEQLETRTVYQNAWMTVREDLVGRPDGTTGIYGVVDKADFALVIPGNAVASGWSSSTATRSDGALGSFPGLVVRPTGRRQVRARTCRAEGGDGADPRRARAARAPVRRVRVLLARVRGLPRHRPCRRPGRPGTHRAGHGPPLCDRRRTREDDPLRRGRGRCHQRRGTRRSCWKRPRPSPPDDRLSRRARQWRHSGKGQLRHPSRRGKGPTDPARETCTESSTSAAGPASLGRHGREFFLHPILASRERALGAAPPGLSPLRDRRGQARHATGATGSRRGRRASPGQLGDRAIAAPPGRQLGRGRQRRVTPPFGSRHPS